MSFAPETPKVLRKDISFERSIKRNHSTQKEIKTSDF